MIQYLNDNASVIIPIVIVALSVAYYRYIKPRVKVDPKTIQEIIDTAQIVEQLHSRLFRNQGYYNDKSAMVYDIAETGLKFIQAANVISDEAQMKQIVYESVKEAMTKMGQDVTAQDSDLIKNSIELAMKLGRK